MASAMMDDLASVDFQRDAFAKVIDSCLAMKSGEQFLVVYDETFLVYLPLLGELVVARDLPTTFIFIPRLMQDHFCQSVRVSAQNTWLPVPVEQALSLAHGVLHVVSGAVETLPFRLAILKVTRSKECRFAHVPGINNKVLEMVASSPFDEILERGELVAWALGQADQALLTTRDSTGREYALAMDLGGWKNEPLMSPGLIYPGSWGNLPPGETFCCPDPQKISGQVCISGSVPGYVIQPGEEVVLTFEKGRLLRWDANAASPALAFFEKARSRHEEQSDFDWNLFAELGVGLNPAIPALTGSPLYDEKVAGTLHIAIGENTNFGHNNKANWHADMAILKPTLVLGDLVLVNDGKLAVDDIHARRDAWVAPRCPLPAGKRIRLNTADIVEVDGKVYRRLCKADRVGRVRMASDHFDEKLLRVVRALTRSGSLTVESLEQLSSDINHPPLCQVLDLLLHYECVVVS